MNTKIPFATVNWSEIPTTEHKGEKGIAYWKSLQLGDLRVRMVEYAPGYIADHWCRRVHIIYCIEGEMITKMEDGQTFTLSQGMSYHVSDNLSSHKSETKTGVKLFIVDGGFLK